MQVDELGARGERLGAVRGGDGGDQRDVADDEVPTRCAAATRRPGLGGDSSHTAREEGLGIGVRL